MSRLFAHRTKSIAAGHAEWLSLVEPVGAFLTVPVLKRAFPNGLERTDADTRADLRVRLDNLGRTDTERTTWLRWVLGDLLGLQDELREGPAVPVTLTHTVAEHATVLRPDCTLTDSDGTTTRLIICRWPLGTALDRSPKNDPDGRPSRWSASPIERASTLCRSVGVPLALVTDTDRFALVWAPKGGAGGHGIFVSSLFSEERELLDAFCSLLGARRWFAVAESEMLDALFTESGETQAEVTNQLGKQVREAVELMIAAFSRAHRSSGLKLLAKVSPEEVYSAAVTVMMRLVVLLSAEERRLLPIDDDLYVSSYAISSLRDQLEDERLNDGEDALERRSTAWYRLLAAFRAVHGGLRHDRLTLPAYGSKLFDPDRYPFLEGRTAHGGQPADGHPLPVDDLTVLAILDALQVLTFREGGVTEARRLSYRGLDVEQIGHVYEGLLDHSCTITSDLAVGLIGKKGDEEEIGVAQLEEWSATGQPKLLAELEALTGKKSKALLQLLDATPSHQELDRLRSACDNDEGELTRLLPFAGLIRPDLRGLPTVFMPNALYVTQTSQRRDSGTEYTTKELADEVVRYALEPLVYSPGPADGVEPDQWVLKSAKDLLSLKVCDPAVGSGAIIVAACRYLADRLVEAWRTESATGAALERLNGLTSDDWTLEARRLVVDHCLYGVDRNPMAVEMAKLSLWLTTMAKERPFTFLDHSFRSGDSLLGITSLEQITTFHLDPREGRKLHRGRLWDVTEVISPPVARALELTVEIASIDVRDVHDAEYKAKLHKEMVNTLDSLAVVADVLVGAALSTAGEKPGAYAARLEGVREDVRKALDVDRSLEERASLLEDLRMKAQFWLDTDRPILATDRMTLHWPLAFPEVFASGAKFDAVIGNPPYQGGTKISGSQGVSYQRHLVRAVSGRPTNRADLAAFFVLRGMVLADVVGFITTNSIAEGDTRTASLERVTDEGWTIFRAIRSRQWPGSASVFVALIWVAKQWSGQANLDSRGVVRIGSDLTDDENTRERPRPLRQNAGKAMSGSKIDVDRFILEPPEAERILSNPTEKRVVRPLLNGVELNNSPLPGSTTRFVVTFGDMTEVEARRFPLAFEHVEENVRPQVLSKPASYSGWRSRWWQFWNPRVALYDAIDPLSRAIAIACTSKTLMPTFVPTNIVFSHAVIVVCSDDAAVLGVLSSSFHWHWAVRYASAMKQDIRYTTSDVYETFPQPLLNSEVRECGERLHRTRLTIMEQNKEGLTKTYNRVHSGDDAASIASLKDLHVDLDTCVAAAYGWTDIELDHGLHETSQGVRFTVAPSAQREILMRLLALNLQIDKEQGVPSTNSVRNGRQPVRGQEGGLFE